MNARHLPRATLFVALIASLATALPALAGRHLPERIVLTSVPGSTVRATVVLTPSGAGAIATARIDRATPDAAARIIANAGTCGRPGASFATAGAGRIGSAGSSQWRARVLFRTAPLRWSTLLDGTHVLRLIIDGKEAACGAIPGMN